MVKNKIVFISMLFCVLFFSACQKEEETQNNNYNNPLVGTSWTCTVWHYLSLNVIAYIDFDSESRATTTLLYRENTSSQRPGSYTFNGSNVTFSNMGGYANSSNYSFNSATFSSSILTVRGTKDGENKTWTFRRK